MAHHCCVTCAHVYVDALTRGYCSCENSALHGNQVINDEGSVQVYSCDSYVSAESVKKED